MRYLFLILVSCFSLGFSNTNQEITDSPKTWVGKKPELVSSTLKEKGFQVSVAPIKGVCLTQALLPSKGTQKRQEYFWVGPCSGGVLEALFQVPELEKGQETSFKNCTEVAGKPSMAIVKAGKGKRKALKAWMVDMNQGFVATDPAKIECK